jgi:GDP-mannose 6-dehydrogenase
MRISIFGLGYVGAVSMACLARDGHEVVGVDVDPLKLDLIRSGRSPIIEEGIQELIHELVSKGRIAVSNDASQAVLDTDLSFVCVGTPSSANGSQDLSAMRRLAEQVGEALARKSAHHVVVIRSTVQPGTVEGVLRPIIEARSGKRAGTEFSLCFQPEFLREGSSIRDYDHPPFTVIGTNSEHAARVLRDLFGHLPCEFFVTSIETSECLKYACNAFHALKVTFANEIGRLAQAFNVDSHEVMHLLCQDTRLNVSSAYLRPGFAFGGSCLPKDLKALLYMGRNKDVVTPLLASLLPSNRVHIDHAIDRVLADGRRAVGMLGLSFKSGTDDLRESPLVTLAERFIGKGLKLRIYDPEVNLSRLMGANRRYIEESIPHIGSLMSSSLAEAVASSDIIVVGTADKRILAELVGLTQDHQLLIDLVKIPGRENLKGRYQGICW